MRSRKRGVLDAGAVEQVEQLGRVGVGGGGPRLDVCGGGELFAGFDLGDLRLPPPVAEALGELRSRGAGGEAQLAESLGELRGGFVGWGQPRSLAVRRAGARLGSRRAGSRRDGGVPPPAVLLDRDRVVDEPDRLERAGRAVVHEPQALVVEQPVVVPRDVRRPRAGADGDQAYVLAGVDVRRVGSELVADVVAERLFDDVHAHELPAGGDVLAEHRLPRSRRRVMGSPRRNAAKSSCSYVAS